MTREARKHRQDADDLKVLFVGVCLYIMMVLTGPVIMDMWDRHFAPRPFVVAELEILPPLELDQAPQIRYVTHTNQPIDATWIASIFNYSGDRIASRRGTGSYAKPEMGSNIWTWNAFFENEFAYEAPTVPVEPFLICVRYIAEARDSGVHDESPVYCSKLYDPNEGKIYEKLDP